MADGAIEYDINGDVANILAGLGRLEDKLESVDKKNKKVSTSGQGLGNIFETFLGNLAVDAVGKVTGAITELGTQMVDLGIDTVNIAGDFEAQMNSIRAISGLTKDELNPVRDLALQLGKDTKYSALETAQGMEELIKAGLTIEQVLGGGAKSALTLAAAGEIEVKDAAEIASIALNTFKKDNLSVAKAADILAGAANASATDVLELKYGLAQAGVVANSLGLTFEDTATALSVFAQNGLKGSDAGTSLKTMLSNLQPTTKKQMELMEKLGLATIEWEIGANGAKKEGKALTNAFFDQNGKIKDLASVSQVLQEKLGGMNEQQKALALETLFGSDAIRAGTILTNEGAEGFKNMAGEMAKVTAEQVAQTRMEGWNAGWESFKGTLETIQIQLGSQVLPFLSTGLSYINNLLNGNAEDNALTRILTFSANQLSRLGTELGPPFKQMLLDVYAQAKEFLNNNEGRLKNMFENTMNFIIENGPAVIDMIGQIAKVAMDVADAFLKADEKVKELTKNAGGIGGIVASNTSIGQVFGAQKSLNTIQNAIFGKKNATGDTNFGGGFSVVGENGPEIVQMPKGSSISTASQSQGMNTTNNNQKTVINQFKFSSLSDLRNQLAFY